MVKKRMWAVLVLALAATAAGAATTVSNVTARQRPGTKLVDIAYDVASDVTNRVTVAVTLSNAAGRVSASNFTGHLGVGVPTGAGRWIVWNGGADQNGQRLTGLSVAIDASDGAGAPAAPAGMVLIPAGGFQMGNCMEAGEGGSGELPLHNVQLSAFYMDRYEVTKAKWDAVYAWAVAHAYTFDNAGSGEGTNHPVHTVSWYDCVKWCNARSEKEGLTPCYYTDAGQTAVYRSGQVGIESGWVKWGSGGYRLPTEAEWEKAARGGTAGHRFPWIDADTIAHSRANYRAVGGETYDQSNGAGYHPTYNDGTTPYTSPVGAFAANGYGLYDMAGNVWEWCWDWYDGGWYANAGATGNDSRGAASGSDRVKRGGGWHLNANYCRVAIRSYDAADNRRDIRGFRAVRAAGQ